MRKLKLFWRYLILFTKRVMSYFCKKEKSIIMYGYGYGYGYNIESIGEDWLESSLNGDSYGWMYMGLGTQNLYGSPQIYYDFNEPLGIDALYDDYGDNTKPNIHSNNKIDPWQYIPLGVSNI